MKNNNKQYFIAQNKNKNSGKRFQIIISCKITMELSKVNFHILNG